VPLPRTLCRCGFLAKPLGIARAPLAWAAFAGLMAMATPAAAVDGCLVLLCFAAPSWRAIPQCVPPVRKVLHDLAKGRPFPTCSISGAGNSASQQWARPPSYCPPQYTHMIDGEGMPVYTCDYAGAVSVDIDGSLWTRTWWNFDGETVTEYTAKAKAGLGTWETKFDDDYAAWLAMQPPPCPGCGD
jgi:hypothetical protein